MSELTGQRDKAAKEAARQRSRSSTSDSSSDSDEESESSGPSRKRRSSNSGHSHKKKKRRRHDSSSSSSEDSEQERIRRKKQKLKKKERKKRKREKEKKIAKKKKKKRKKEKKQEAEAESKTTSAVVRADPEVVSHKVAVSVPDAAAGEAGGSGPRVMGAMTQAQWLQQQNVLRHVTDPETGRKRLIRGDGEIVEEIVSKERHLEINKQSTKGDAMFYAMKAGLTKMT